MSKKFLKKAAAIVTVVSFITMTSATAFAGSANGTNDFSVLGNIPAAQAVPLNDKEMKEVRGEVIVIDDILIMFAVALVASVASDIIATYLKHWLSIDGTATAANGQTFNIQVIYDCYNHGGILNNFTAAKYNTIYNGKIGDPYGVAAIVNGTAP